MGMVFSSTKNKTRNVRELQSRGYKTEIVRTGNKNEVFIKYTKPKPKSRSMGIFGGKW